MELGEVGDGPHEIGAGEGEGDARSDHAGWSVASQSQNWTWTYTWFLPLGVTNQPMTARTATTMPTKTMCMKLILKVEVGW